MSWRDRLQPGTLDGVPFHVDSNSLSFGPRTVVHEYPQRDKPYVEHMGLKAREFTLELFVLGADYDRDRDALVAVIEKPGQHELVIPKRGRITVAVTQARYDERKSEGGKASFSVTFIEDGGLQFPTAKPLTQRAVAGKATAARGALVNAFAKVFKILNKPSYIAENAAALVRNATDQLRIVNGGIAALTAPYAALARDIDQLGSEINTLMRAPVTLATTFVNLVGSVRGAVADVQSAIDVYDNLYFYGADLPAVPVTTANRQIEADNQAAILELTQVSAAISLAEAQSSRAFASDSPTTADADAVISLRDAQIIRDTVAERLESLALATADDDLYLALTELRAVTINDINTRAVELPRIISFTPVVTQPMLLIAHRLYGDATREAELVARNNIRNPMFVAGGVALEALDAA